MPGENFSKNQFKENTYFLEFSEFFEFSEFLEPVLVNVTYK